MTHDVGHLQKLLERENEGERVPVKRKNEPNRKESLKKGGKFPYVFCVLKEWRFFRGVRRDKIRQNGNGHEMKKQCFSCKFCTFVPMKKSGVIDHILWNMKTSDKKVKRTIERYLQLD